MSVPEGAYFGVQTQRALENFPISGLKAAPALVDAMMVIKKTAAEANARLNQIPDDKAQAIVQACEEVLEGRFRDQFPVDVFQMGAGTSFHMNCNEVIANRAAEILGGKRGDYALVHPNDQVNRGQSTNDVIPTAMRLSVLMRLQDHVFPPLKAMAEALDAKGKEFDGILKSGRTHLQDAAPIRLGQEFNAYAEALHRGEAFLKQAAGSLLELGIGGSGVGTGLNTPPEYRELMIRALSAATGFPFSAAKDPREAMQSMQVFAQVSAALRNIALELTRVANDLRLLSSGPRTGWAEIKLPPVAPGSSFMPGKVNPSMLEMLNMVCCQIVGNDSAICYAVQAGQLELNVMMPVIAFNLHFSLEILGNSLRLAKERCIEGITADPERCAAYAEASLGLMTALTPTLGYALASEVAKEAVARGKNLTEILEERGLFSPEQLSDLLDPERMTEPQVLDPDQKGGE
jgi:aspartate ammonia-lyase